MQVVKHCTQTALSYRHSVWWPGYADSTLLWWLQLCLGVCPAVPRVPVVSRVCSTPTAATTSTPSSPWHPTCWRWVQVGPCPRAISLQITAVALLGALLLLSTSHACSMFSSWPVVYVPHDEAPSSLKTSHALGTA